MYLPLSFKKLAYFILKCPHLHGCLKTNVNRGLQKLRKKKKKAKLNSSMHYGGRVYTCNMLHTACHLQDVMKKSGAPLELVTGFLSLSSYCRIPHTHSGSTIRQWSGDMWRA